MHGHAGGDPHRSVLLATRSLFPSDPLAAERKALKGLYERPEGRWRREEEKEEGEEEEKVGR